MPLILGAQSASAAVAQGNSCRFNDGDSPYMYRTPSSTNRRTWTYSAWIKRGTLGARQGLVNINNGGNPYEMIELIATNALKIEDYDGGTDTELITSAKYEDVGAWYHMVVAYDTTQAVDTNRIKLYVNGSQVTEFSTETYCAQDFETEFNNSVQVEIGKEQSNYFDGYMAEVCFVDGTQYAASDFGEFDADSPTIWKPKDVSGLTFGTNGWYMDFKDSADLGADAAGSNDHTVSGIAAADQGVDSPTNNFATLNLLDNYYQAATFSEGNNTIVTGSDKYGPSTSTLGMSAGKWYWEVKPTARGGGNDYLIGVTSTQLLATTEELGHFPNDWAYYSSNGYYRNNNGTTSYGDSWDTDDIIGFALDLDNNKLYFSKTNVWQNSGVPTSGATGTGAISITAPASTPLGAYFAGVAYWDSGTATINANFGGCSAFALTSAESDENGYGNFEYEPPSGYLALCTKNLGSDGG